MAMVFATARRCVMTERFTRMAPTCSMYRITMDDPKTYTRPWTLQLPLVSPPGLPDASLRMSRRQRRHQVHPRAERAEDKAIEEDLKKGIVRPRKDPQNDINRAPEE